MTQADKRYGRLEPIPSVMEEGHLSLPHHRAAANMRQANQRPPQTTESYFLSK